MSRRKEDTFTIDASLFKSAAQASAAQALLDEGNVPGAAKKLGCRPGSLRKLLGREDFCEALQQERKRKEAESRQRLREEIFEEWRAVAFADAGEYLQTSAEADGTVSVSLRDLNACRDTRAIAEISPGSSGNFKLKLYDKTQALQQLGKLLGLSQEESTPQKILVELKGETDRWAK